MGLPLSTLIAPSTVEQLDATTLALLQSEGFPTTAWQSGSVPLTLIRIASQTGSDLSTLIAFLAQAGFAVLAAAMVDDAGVEIPDWLDLIGENFYEETRDAAQSTVGDQILTDASGSPTVIAIGQLWSQTPEGKRYTNVTGGTLTALGTLTLSWQAESPGASYNVPNDTITLLATPIPGVSINNPAGGSGTWITTSGKDAEGNASFLQRLITKWASLGTGSNRDAYVYWAKKAAPTITRVLEQSDNPVGPGTVQLVIANNGGAPTGDELQAVKDYIGAQGAADTTKGVKPETVTVYVIAATVDPITVTGTVHVLSANLAAAQTKASDQVLAYAQSLMGGITGADKIDLGLLYSKFFSTGVTEIDISVPAADVTLALGHVPTISLSGITWIAV